MGYVLRRTIIPGPDEAGNDVLIVLSRFCATVVFALANGAARDAVIQAVADGVCRSVLERRLFQRRRHIPSALSPSDEITRSDLWPAFRSLLHEWRAAGFAGLVCEAGLRRVPPLNG